MVGAGGRRDSARVVLREHSTSLPEPVRYSCEARKTALYRVDYPSNVIGLEIVKGHLLRFHRRRIRRRIGHSSAISSAIRTAEDLSF